MNDRLLPRLRNACTSYLLRLTSHRGAKWLGAIAVVVWPVLLASAFGLGPTPPPPKWAEFGARMRDGEPARSDVAKQYDRDEIVRLLRPEALVADEKQAEILWTVIAKPWRALPGLSVAAMEVHTFKNVDKDKGRDAGSTVYLVVLSGGTAGLAGTVKARTSIRLANGERLEELDLAVYRITKKDVAVGVRTTQTFDQNPWTNKLLSLFIMDGPRLRRVWSTTLSHSARSSVWADDDSRQFYTQGCDEPATIEVLKSSSHGFFTLMKAQEGRTVFYEWDGRKYKPDGEDPVNMDDDQPLVLE